MSDPELAHWKTVLLDEAKKINLDSESTVAMLGILDTVAELRTALAAAERERDEAVEHARKNKAGWTERENAAQNYKIELCDMRDRVRALEKRGLALINATAPAWAGMGEGDCKALLTAAITRFRALLTKEDTEPPKCPEVEHE